MVEPDATGNLPSSGRKPSRREVLHWFGRIGGAAGVFHTMAALGLLPDSPARADLPNFPADVGAGKRAIVLGAGVAGLASGLILARHGFDVTVLEADNRAGGRSLTVRRGDTIAETSGPIQLGRFSQNHYADGTPTESEPYFDTGPGRIPHHHSVTLDWCRRLGVRLEPYIFLSEANLLQSDRAFGGKPIPFRSVRFNLRGEIAEMLAKVSDQSALDEMLDGIDRDALRALLSRFGDLSRSPDGDPVFGGTERAGYTVPPGAGPNAGTLAPPVELSEILGSGFWRWDLFTSLQYYWQTSLLQPVGGMDRIWRAMLRQEVPGGRTLSDLVMLSRSVRSVRILGNDSVEVSHGPADAPTVERADFVVSTLPPRRLLSITKGVSGLFHAALTRIGYIPAAKVAFQMKSRFWERNDGIYGGISWTSGITRQLWYPSSEHHSETGVLVAAYNNGRAAQILGAQPLGRRFQIAATYGERLHPGHFTSSVTPETALSVAWQNMPHVDGGWPVSLAKADPDAYQRMVKLTPQGRLYLAGDYFSHLPGWQEGALAAAELASSSIIERTLSGG